MKLLREIQLADALAILGLWGLSIAYFFVIYYPDGPPFEDAAMLMRYAGHLANGHGIVWNPGEAPVDGATDFFFMVSVGGLHALGLELGTAVRLLTIGAHLLTIAFVYLGVRRIFDLSFLWALLPAAFIAFGPAWVYIEAYFGTTYFALFGTLTYYRMLRAFHGDTSARNGFWWALFGLLLGLTRPEGVFLVAMTWAVGIAWHGFQKMRPTTLWFLAWFGTIGLGYFVWHWSYFGHPLPNPFYVKGGGIVYPSSLKAALFNTFKMALPVMLVIVAGFFQDRKKVIKGAFILFPAFAFVAIWIFLSNAMNYGMRFQYVVVPILLMTWPGVVGEAVKNWPLNWTRHIALATLGIMLLSFQHWNYGRGVRMPADGRVALGKALAPYADQGYRMAVTEAGNLPYFSGWTSLDTWGLNHAQVAHEGISSDILEAYQPALILVHDYGSPGTERLVLDSAWTRMVDTVTAYALSHQYELVACYGSYPASTHYYYLDPQCPDFGQFKAQIRDMDYRWYENGEAAQNFLEREPDLQNFDG